MKKKDIKIMIVEDDLNLGKAIKEAISDAGFDPVLVSTPKEALYNNKLFFISAFVIDCLLPQMSGLDLALQLRQSGANKQPLFFMSGVFQEAGFFDEAKQKTNATAFFEKPFSIPKLISKLNQLFNQDKGKIESKDDLTTSALTQPHLSEKERLKLIANVKKLHGFTLPQVIKILLFPKISGILKLKSADQEYCIYFSKGRISAVKMNQNETKSFFGEILINKNLMSFEELKPFLSDSVSEIKIGERLVQANLLSPHIINEIIKEQISIRLSQLIRDVYYNISFEESPIALKDQTASLDYDSLKELYAKCFRSKIPFQHIKNIYLDKLNYKIQTTPNFSLSIFQHILFKETGDILKQIKDQSFSLISLIDKKPEITQKIYYGIHLLSSINMIYLQPQEKEEDSKMVILRLQKVANDMKNQNHFEVLNISKKAKASDIKQAYKKLSKIFHPNAVMYHNSKEIEALSKDIFSKIQAGYEVLSDDKKRGDYELSLEHENVKVTLQSEHFFEEGKQALHLNNKRTALDLLKKSVDIHPNPPSHFQLYLIWARLINFSTSDDNIDTQIMDIQSTFDKILPENRNTPLFYLVKGLFYKQIKDKEATIRNLQYAAYLDPTYEEVKRQLKLMSYDVEKKNVSIFKRDLKDVIKSAFPFLKKKIG